MEEKKRSCPWEHCVISFTPSSSMQSVFIYLQVEGVPFQIASLWWMQAAAGSCYLTLSLGLFVFGFQLSYHDIYVLCIPWHVRLDQTTTCHTEQQIKSVWVSCRYISPGIGKFKKLSLVENILVCSKHPLDHVSLSLGWLEFFFVCTVWNLKGNYAI